MVKFDHMNLPVTNYQASRDWYVRNFGFKVEFEVPDRKTTAIQDDAGFTIFLYEQGAQLSGAKCSLTLQVDAVDSKYKELQSKGVAVHESTRQILLGLRRRTPRSRRLPALAMGRSVDERKGRLEITR